MSQTPPVVFVTVNEAAGLGFVLQLNPNIVHPKAKYTIRILPI
jgi:hypothetical protein